MFNSSSTDSHFYNNDIDEVFEVFKFFLSSSGNNKSEIDISFHLQIKIEINILRKINFWARLKN